MTYQTSATKTGTLAMWPSLALKVRLQKDTKNDKTTAVGTSQQHLIQTEVSRGIKQRQATWGIADILEDKASAVVTVTSSQWQARVEMMQERQCGKSKQKKGVACSVGDP